MKLLYLAYMNYDNPSGVLFKIEAQIKAFESEGYDVQYFFINNNRLFLRRKEGNIEISKIGEDSIITKNIFYFKLLLNLSKLDYPFEIIYQRKISSNPVMNRILKSIRKQSRYILQEIPTYPYRGEITKDASFVEKIKMKVDLMFRKSELKYIDYIVTYSNDAEIDGKKTIIVDNSVNRKYQKVKPKLVSDEIRLIAVSNLVFWQGYDRLIEGLNTYYKNKSNLDPLVILDIVGNGPEESALRLMTKNYNLDDYIIFHGFKKEKELDEIFEKSDIAIAILGLHRKGMSQVSALKTKEYLARNLPFVYAGSERYIDDFDMVLQVTPDETPLDIHTVIDFRVSLNDKINEFYKYEEIVRKHFTWEIQVEKIISYLGSAK